MKLKSKFNVELIHIDKCYHFRGYRYGGFGNNLYEDYIVGIKANKSLQELRDIFTSRIIGSRANDFGKILMLDLERSYAPWRYPWDFNIFSNYRSYSPSKNPDIVCHTSSNGIIQEHIDREFFWLERSYKAIKDNGYKPEKFGYIKLLALKNKNEERYIVLDGNHRISAMHALGESVIRAHVVRKRRLSIEWSYLWPSVLLNIYSHEDALKVFLRYFKDGNLEIPQDGKSIIIK